MARTTLGDDDPAHQLPDFEKEKLEKELRRQAREHQKKNEPKKKSEKNNRATNISREPSKIQQHH
jgi:hypothetical protein